MFSVMTCVWGTGVGRQDAVSSRSLNSLILNSGLRFSLPLSTAKGTTPPSSLSLPLVRPLTRWLLNFEYHTYQTLIARRSSEARPTQGRGVP